ncbi:DNA-directed RNA polymerase III subunit RPC8 isoform X1 [Pezoporus occidentalis]|uniref:DNA-directed RNA polymerase III subunit RPC8 isoform X1 n=1 Tax=Pezoporus flaviventris TaxID=889875 RepID=UPI002AB01762|nr:DNA-directed RNA polymerase III subunit RPC8 isoform X1 [Pezoporus flaviventris]
MFVLVEMTDTVRIAPWQFERKLNDSIAEELNKKLANKVVYNVGLCICLYDITKLEDSYIFPGDGASHTKVHFRYVVFHPFLDEILIGQIKSCSQDGVHVSVGFFDDIVIPPESLQQPAKLYPLITFDNFTTSFQRIVQCWPNSIHCCNNGGAQWQKLSRCVSDEAEQVWVWEYETEEGAHDLYMDIGEEIRFRVVDETFVDTSPTGPSSAEASASNATEEVQKKEAPYTLVGSISEPGLGLLSWWTNS